MTKPQTLEEAWFRLSAHPPCTDEMCSSCEIEEDAARALAQAVLEEAYDYDAKHNHRAINAGCCRYHDLQRQIEALGK